MPHRRRRAPLLVSTLAAAIAATAAACDGPTRPHPAVAVLGTWHEVGTAATLVLAPEGDSIRATYASRVDCAAEPDAPVVLRGRFVSPELRLESAPCAPNDHGVRVRLRLVARYNPATDMFGLADGDWLSYLIFAPRRLVRVRNGT